MRKESKKLAPNQGVSAALENTRILPLPLAMKLGSIAVHAEELLSTDGRILDQTVIKVLLNDPEVTAWIKTMGALLPVKRR